MSPSRSNRVLPPGLDETTFDKALEELENIVGRGNVSSTWEEGSLDGPHGQRQYGDLWPLAETNTRTPSGAIRPKSVQEVQDILKVANRYNLHLWTVSRGKNLGFVQHFNNFDAEVDIHTVMAGRELWCRDR